MKEAILTSDVIEKVLTAKTAEELIAGLKEKGIVKEEKEAEAILQSEEHGQE